MFCEMSTLEIVSDAGASAFTSSSVCTKLAGVRALPSISSTCCGVNGNTEKNVDAAGVSYITAARWAAALFVGYAGFRQATVYLAGDRSAVVSARLW